jgi:hypothetical protein
MAIRLRRSRWVSGDNRNIYTIFIVKLEGKRQCGRYEGNIKTNQKGTSCERVNWINLKLQ